MALPDLPPTFKPIAPPELAWRWRFHDVNGSVVEGDTLQTAGESAAQRFPSRGDAESWLGEAWRDLAAGGVASARLFEDDREVGAPVELVE